MMLLNQLKSAVELSSSLQAQHTAAKSTISALELKVTSLEMPVRTSQAQDLVLSSPMTQLPRNPIYAPSFLSTTTTTTNNNNNTSPLQSDSLTQMLNS